MKRAKIFLKYLGYIVLGFLLLRILLGIFFTPYIVGSDSMVPTLLVGDYFIAENTTVPFFDIKRGDVVLFPPNEQFNKGVWVHRAIALEGDKVEIKNGLVSVNGVPAEFPNINAEDENIIIPPGMIYEKGDNPDTIHGLADKSIVLGKFLFKLKW